MLIQFAAWWAQALWKRKSLRCYRYSKNGVMFWATKWSWFLKRWIIKRKNEFNRFYQLQMTSYRHSRLALPRETRRSFETPLAILWSVGAIKCLVLRNLHICTRVHGHHELCIYAYLWLNLQVGVAGKRGEQGPDPSLKCIMNTTIFKNHYLLDFGSPS